MQQRVLYLRKDPLPPELKTACRQASAWFDGSEGGTRNSKMADAESSSSSNEGGSRDDCEAPRLLERVSICPVCCQSKRLQELWHEGMSKERFEMCFSDAKLDLYDYCVECYDAKQNVDRAKEETRLNTEAWLHGYLCPQFSGYLDGHTWMFCPSLEFSSTQPNFDDLIGNYDILFFASREDLRSRYSRTTKGKLVLSMTDGQLHGQVIMDESVQHYAIPKPGCFTFKDTGWWNDDTRSQCVKVVEFPDDYVQGFQTWSPGYLKIVAARAAVPRWPDNFRRAPARWEVRFDSIEDAIRIQRGYFHPSHHSWIYNHFNLPESVGSLIAEFVVPPPLFFFEPGDLWLHMCWEENNLIRDEDGLETVLLARRERQDA